MPLQIRRGLEAERQAMTLPLAQGELLYVTDDRKLFVGDGTTVGGVAIASYTNKDAQDAAAALFTNGQHTNISFTYDNSLARINATVNLSQYNGSITASEFRGSIVADDSTLLFNSNTGQLNLQGTIGTPVVPDTTNVYDIGSTSYKFRELYLSGANIYLGGATIAAVGATVNLPAGSTVNGVEISTGSSNVEADTAPKLGGNLDLNGKNITGTGNIDITGTLKVSVGLGGELLLNSYSITGSGSISINGSISNGTVTIDSGNITTTSIDNSHGLTSPAVKFGSPSLPASQITYSNHKLAVFVGTNNAASIEIKNSRGTLLAPTASQSGDSASVIKGFSHDGTDWNFVGSYGMIVDPAVPVSTGSIAGTFFVLVEDEVNDSKILSFNSKGVLTAPVMKAASYATGSLPTAPEEGWMVFDSTTKQFKGWNGTAWVVLG